MGERDRTGAHRPTAYRSQESCRARGMVRRLKRWASIFPRNGSVVRNEGVNGHDIDGLRRSQIRKQAGQSFGEQGLTHSRRPKHGEAVSTSRRYLQAPTTIALIDDIGEVRLLTDPSNPPTSLVSQSGILPGEHCHGVRERSDADNAHARHAATFIDVLGRHDDGREASLLRRTHDGDGSRNRSHPTIETQLADDHRRTFTGKLDLLIGCEYANGNGKVQARPVLSHMSWRQADSDATQRPHKACIADGATSTMPSLVDRSVREPDQADGW